MPADQPVRAVPSRCLREKGGDCLMDRPDALLMLIVVIIDAARALLELILTVLFGAHNNDNR